MSTDIKALESVMAENRDMQSLAGQQGEIPNVSTDQVIENEVFETRAYDQALQARAGFSEHLNLATKDIPQGRDDLSRFRDSWNTVAGQLKKMRLPDTRVNVGGERIEISANLKQYANDIDQARYIRIMHTLLGTDTMRAVLRHATKSNQANKPALWFNQAIAVECKKQYAMLFAAQLADEEEATIEQKAHIEHAREAAEALGMDKVQLIDKALRDSFGAELHGLMTHVAKGNRLPLYAVLLLVVEEIIHDRDNKGVPVTPLSIWAGIASVEEPRPAQTAVDKMEQLTALIQKR